MTVTAVRIELLGGFRLLLDDDVVERGAWPSRRSAELVMLLALSERQVLQREQVLDLLWPHLSEAAGAANLRKAAHHARQATGRRDAVVLAGGAVRLFPGTTVATDVACFERLAAAGAWSEASRAYAGDLLPDARYEQWCADRRDSLRATHLTVLGRNGEWDRLAALEPADEQAQCKRMRAALAQERRHDALRIWGTLRHAMERDLGLTPGPAARALYEECLAGLHRIEGGFHGRDVELALSVSALDAATHHGSAAVAVRGPAGIGKSTLCRQLVKEARGRGWTVLSVVAIPADRAYAPLVQVVEGVLRAGADVAGSLPAGARSSLARLTSLVGDEPSPAGELNRHQVIGGVHRVLMAAATGAGTMLVVDDAHLADAATLEACVQLAQARGPHPLAVVLAFRLECVPAALTRSVGELERAGRCTRVELGPMSGEELTSMVAAAAPGPVVAQIVDRAAGNPFVALELASGVGVGPDLAVPGSVWEAVTARLVDLDQASVAMLRRLAISAADLQPEHVIALTGLTEPDAWALLDAALASGVLIVAGGGYRFRHDLVRVALLEHIPPHHRLALQRETAKRLAAAGAEPSRVAEHWLAGNAPAEATPWLLMAARQASGLGAFVDALRYADLVLRHTPDEFDALVLRAQSLEALGDVQAPAAYDAAARGAGPLQRDDLRAFQALAQIKGGDPPGGLRTLEGIAPVSVKGRMAQALAWSGAAVLGFTAPDVGTAMAAESRRLALESADHPTLVIASWAQAAAAHARDDLRSSVWADLLDTAALPQLAVSVFDGHLCISQRLLYGARPYPDVIAFANAFEGEAKRLRATRGIAYALTLRGEAHLLAGHLDAADTDLAAAARLSRSSGGAVGEGLALQRRAEVARQRGDVEQARRFLDEALAVARDSDCGFHLLDRIYGTRITLAQDRLPALIEAEQSVRGPNETCPGCRITLAVPAAIAAARVGDFERLESWTQTTTFLAEVVMRLPAWDAALEEVHGHGAAARGEHARPYFVTAARRFREIGQPLDEQRCLQSAGGA